MYGTRGDTIPELVTGIPDSFRGMVDVGSRIENGNETIRLSRHHLKGLKVGSASKGLVCTVVTMTGGRRGVPVRIPLRHHRLDFSHGHDWQKANEQKEQDAKNSKGPKEGEYLDYRWAVVPPA